MTKILIDLEFNGLYRYNFIPEITQVKVKNISTGESRCINFKTKNEGYLREFYGEIKGQVYFSKEWFKRIIRSVGGSLKDNFYGFSISTDKQVLKEYGIILENYFDIQERMMCSKKYEALMAYGGRSLEACYFIVTGNKNFPDHNSIDEMELIEKIYKNIYKGRPCKYLTIVPWGQEAGMPLKEYIISFRRRADGYRYNNNDIFAKSLDYYISKEEEDYYF